LNAGAGAGAVYGVEVWGCDVCVVCRPRVCAACCLYSRPKTPPPTIRILDGNAIVCVCRKVVGKLEMSGDFLLIADNGQT
jgi:hypothetical protein